MLKQQMKDAANEFIEGLIDETELAIRLIKALGQWNQKDDSITDVAFILQNGDEQ